MSADAAAPRATLERLLAALAQGGPDALRALVARDAQARSDAVAAEVRKRANQAARARDVGGTRSLSTVAFAVHEARGELKEAEIEVR